MPWCFDLVEAKRVERDVSEDGEHRNDSALAHQLCISVHDGHVLLKSENEIFTLFDNFLERLAALYVMFQHEIRCMEIKCSTQY